MRRLAAFLCLTPALVAAACLDTTEPQPLVDGRVAHAITGAEQAVFSVDLVPTFQLAAHQHAYFVVSATPRTYGMEVAGLTLSLDIPHDRDITAILLMDLEGPALRAFHLDRVDAAQRIAVINAHDDAGAIDVTLTGIDSAFELELAPGQAGIFEPPTGSFELAVRGQDDDEFVALPGFELFPDDHGFLVIVPGTGDIAYARLLF